MGAQKYNLILLLAGLGILAALNVFAVGSGGGGGTTCTADEWTCGAWSDCSAEGRRTRTCALTLDCSGFDNLKPSETESCTPPQPPPAPSPAPQPTTAPTSPSPAKIPEGNFGGQAPSQSCTADRFECSSWSETCDIYGRHNRSCSKVFDCQSAATTPPETSKACERLQCGNLPTLRERILCRLNLAPAGIARELELQYLPEECRALSDHDQQEACEERYESFKPCWNVPAGEERFACARNILKLGPVVLEEVKKCKGLTGQARASCSQELKAKVYEMIKFRLYDLEQRAERLGERGASLEAIADLETKIEEAKQAFNAAISFEERLQIISEVRNAWVDFLKKVKDEVK